MGLGSSYLIHDAVSQSILRNYRCYSGHAIEAHGAYLGLHQFCVGRPIDRVLLVRKAIWLQPLVLLLLH